MTELDELKNVVKLLKKLVGYQAHAQGKDPTEETKT